MKIPPRGIKFNSQEPKSSALPSIIRENETMNEAIQIKLDLLIQELRKSAPKTATCVTIFVNASEATVKWSHRTPETLKSEGVSMRNLAGEFAQMRDLIDKIAMKRARELEPALRNIYLSADERLRVIAEEIARDMREAVRLSGGTVPELQSEK